MHEIRGAVRHEPNDVAVSSDYLGVHVCSDVLFNLAHSLSLFHIQSFTFKDEPLG